jgi:hypothetical protein
MRKLSVVFVATLLPGCGLEALIADATDTEYVLPVSVIQGTVTNTPETVTVIKPDGTAVEAIDVDIRGNNFTLELPSTDYANLRLVAEQGESRLQAFLPVLDKDATVAGVVLDPRSTATVLAIDAAMSAKSRTLQVITPTIMRTSLLEAEKGYAEVGSDQAVFLAMVEKVIGAARLDKSTRVIKDPAFNAAFEATASTLDEPWLAEVQIDYTGDQQVDTASTAFDVALGRAAKLVPLDGCLDKERIRVVLEVNFNDGLKDGNCDAINRFKWVRDEPNKRMFFVGGIHMESPIQDSAIDASMGNTAGWTPNTVPMFDDGTNGDAVAGDNIWTVSYTLPKGLRIGYKYTWGTQGALWTGSEEWPGNQHILEIVDVNGDNFVYRQDNFGEEATNKDKSNLNRRGRGVVTWDTDVNMDGIPDARERPIDLDNNCTLDEWITPSGIGPATIECEGAEGQ